MAFGSGRTVIVIVILAVIVFVPLIVGAPVNWNDTVALIDAVAARHRGRSPVAARRSFTLVYSHKTTLSMLTIG